MIQERVKPGRPEGGQFAATARSAPADSVVLAEPEPLDQLADAAHAAWADVIAAGAHGDSKHDQRLIDRAVELGISDDRHLLGSALSHYLTPVVGWVRSDFAREVAITAEREAAWHRRVDLAVDDLRGHLEQHLEDEADS